MLVLILVCVVVAISIALKVNRLRQGMSPFWWLKGGKDV